MSHGRIENETVTALKKSNVARYIQLASLFRSRIESGEWGVGDKIPNVEALAKYCGVATMTIRQALDQLEHEDLIERFRAKGTFVKNIPPNDLWCEVPTSWTDLLVAREDATIEILKDERDVQLLRRGEGLVGTLAPSYRHLRRLHWRDGKAFLVADLFIDERVCHHIEESAYSQLTAMRMAADIPGQKIVDAHQVASIGAADLETSTSLNIPIGAPVGKVKRFAVNEVGDIILVVDGNYRGDMVKISNKLV